LRATQRDVTSMPPALLLLLGGLFTGAVLAITLKIALIALATGPLDLSGWSLGLLLALVGLGALAGPPSIPRLLGRFPVGLLVSGCVVSSAVAIALLSQTSSLAISVPLLFGIGVASITADLLTTTATRRFAPDQRVAEIARYMLLVATLGQSVAAAAIAIVGRYWSLSTVLLMMSVVCAGAMGLFFVAGNAGRWSARRI
jgi:hypothetical protein